MAGFIQSRRTVLAGVIAFGLMTSSGCSPITTLYFLFKGDGKQPAKYPLEPLDKERKDVRVIVMAMGQNLSWEFAGIDREVASLTAKNLAEGTREEKNKIKIIEPRDVEKFKTSNPNWRTMHPSRIAQSLGADYFIDITITGVSLYQEGSGKEVYQGTATADVTVFQTGIEQPKYEFYHKMTMYPQSGDTSVSQYKSLLVKQFTYELASRHMKHTQDSRVAPLTP